MQEQNWDWEQVETFDRGLVNTDYQPLGDPALLEEPMWDDPLNDPLLNDY